MKKTIYKSKVDAWIIIGIYSITVIPVLPSFFMDFSWGVVGVTLFILLMETLLLFNIVYVIQGDCLEVKCSYLFTEKYDIHEITEINSTRTLLAAPAASLERIEIKCGSKMIVISPRKKDEFVKHLLAISRNEIKVRL